MKRSDHTRAAIRRAAQARFAADGYQRATIRAIAADAGIDPAMVMRYYGTKAELFAAAVDVDLRLPDFGELPRELIGASLVTHFMRRWEGNPADDALLTLLRSAATDEAAAECMREAFAGQVTPMIARLCGDDQAPVRAGLIAAQLLGLALVRHIVRLPPIADDDVATLVARVGPTIQHYLTGPLPS